DADRPDNHPEIGTSRAQHGENVVNRGATKRRDDAHATRQVRQRPLALRREESFVGELVAQLLELQAKGADPPRLEGVDVELKGPARFVEPHAAAGDDLEAVAWPEADARRCAPEEHGAELRLFVLQREVEVAGGRHPKIRDLADDPHSVETAIER